MCISTAEQQIGIIKIKSLKIEPLSILHTQKYSLLFYYHTFKQLTSYNYKFFITLPPSHLSTPIYSPVFPCILLYPLLPSVYYISIYFLVSYCILCSPVYTISLYIDGCRKIINFNSKKLNRQCIV